MLNLKTALYALLPLLGLVGITTGGCATTDSQNDENVGAAEQALTPEQCNYFDVNGMVQICHSLPNGKFKMLRVNEQACVNAFSSFPNDYIASLDPNSSLYDPTCQGLGCLPVAAPCDATVPCCDGSTCVDGACVVEEEPEVTCPCNIGGLWTDFVNGPPNNSCRYGYDAIQLGYDGPGLTLSLGECRSANGESLVFSLTPAQYNACLREVENVCGPCAGVCELGSCVPQGEGLPSTCQCWEGFQPAGATCLYY